MENSEHHNIKDSILGKIRAHEVGMHPRYYFMLRVAALAVVSVATLVVSIFILNFLLFSIRINSQDVFLAFGPRGLGAFLAFFPWDLLAVDVALIAILLWLLRQFKFGYKSPLLYVLLGVIGLIVGFGFALDRETGFNDHFLREADEHHLPFPVGDFYGRARRLPPPGSGVCRACTIVEIRGNILTVTDTRGPSTTVRTVVLPPNDPRATTTSLHVGDVIFIAGQEDEGAIRAFGIHDMSSRPANP